MATVYEGMTKQELDRIRMEYVAALKKLEAQRLVALEKDFTVEANAEDYYRILEERSSYIQNVNDLNTAYSTAKSENTAADKSSEKRLGGSISAFGTGGTSAGSGGGYTGGYSTGGGFSGGGGYYGGGGAAGGGGFGSMPANGSTSGGLVGGMYGESSVLPRFGGMMSGAGSNTGIGGGPIGADYDRTPITPDARDNTGTGRGTPTNYNTQLSRPTPDIPPEVLARLTPDQRALLGLPPLPTTGTSGTQTTNPGSVSTLPGGTTQPGEDMTLEELLALLQGVGNTPPGTTPPPGGTTPPPTNTPPTDADNAAYQALLDEYDAAYQTARSESIRQRDEIDAGYDALVAQENAARQEFTGETERQDLATKYNRARGSADQDLINRGLSNTTVRSSVMRGISSDEERSNIALDESIARLNMEMLQNPNSAAMAQLEFQERVSQSYPDMAMMLNLFNQLGEGGVTPAQGGAIANAVNNASGRTSGGITAEQLRALEQRANSNTGSPAGQQAAQDAYNQARQQPIIPSTTQPAATTQPTTQYLQQIARQQAQPTTTAARTNPGSLVALPSQQGIAPPNPEYNGWGTVPTNTPLKTAPNTAVAPVPVAPAYPTGAVTPQQWSSYLTALNQYQMKG